MKNGMKCLVILTLGSLVCFGIAQEERGGGQGRGGGRGGFGQGFRGGAGGGSTVMLLGRDDVQADLKLTDDQKAKLLPIRESLMGKMREMFTGGGDGDMEARRKAMQELQAEASKSVDAILTAEQKQRLKEISVQLAGNRWVLDKENAKTLGITPDQQRRLDGLVAALQKANEGVRERARNGEIQRDQMREITQKNNEALNVEIGKILTDAQKAKLKELGGRPFEAKPQSGRGFGGGRGGG